MPVLGSLQLQVLQGNSVSGEQTATNIICSSSIIVRQLATRRNNVRVSTRSRNILCSALVEPFLDDFYRVSRVDVIGTK